MEKRTLNLIMYIFVCVAILIGVPIQLYKGGRDLAAVLLFIGGLIIAIFFGIRWFDKLGGGDTGSKWPPVINTCPDYLTYFKRTVTGQSSTNTTQNTCIDLLGVSKKPAILKPWGGNDIKNPPTDDGFYFNLDIPKQQGVSKIAIMPSCLRSRCIMGRYN
jgi:hypothetical protein